MKMFYKNHVERLISLNTTSSELMVATVTQHVFFFDLVKRHQLSKYASLRSAGHVIFKREIIVFLLNEGKGKFAFPRRIEDEKEDE